MIVEETEDRPPFWTALPGVIGITLVLTYQLVTLPHQPTEIFSEKLLILNPGQTIFDLPCEAWRRNPDESLTMVVIVSNAERSMKPLPGLTFPMNSPIEQENLAGVVARCNPADSRGVKPGSVLGY